MVDSSSLLPDNFDQNALPASAVKLAVKDALPDAKIKPAVGHGDQRRASRPMICLFTGSWRKLALGFEPFRRAANGLLEFRQKRPVELIDDDR